MKIFSHYDMFCLRAVVTLVCKSDQLLPNIVGNNGKFLKIVFESGINILRVLILKLMWQIHYFM